MWATEEESERQFLASVTLPDLPGPNLPCSAYLPSVNSASDAEVSKAILVQKCPPNRAGQQTFFSWDAQCEIMD